MPIPIMFAPAAASNTQPTRLFQTGPERSPRQEKTIGTIGKSGNGFYVKRRQGPEDRACEYRQGYLVFMYSNTIVCDLFVLTNCYILYDFEEKSTFQQHLTIILHELSKEFCFFI
jgi:hypothetical protein